MGNMDMSIDIYRVEEVDNFEYLGLIKKITKTMEAIKWINECEGKKLKNEYQTESLQNGHLTSSRYYMLQKPWAWKAKIKN